MEHPDQPAGPSGDAVPADPAMDDPAHVADELAADARAVEDEVADTTGVGVTPTGDDTPGAPTATDEFTPEMIDALVAERDEFLDAYRRTAADFDNYRKQSQKRIADEVARALGGFVERLLPVLDAVDAARSHGPDTGDGGTEALAKALFGFLEKEGLERVDPAGEPFDPNVAEAVMHEPGEADEPTVTEVLRTGYVFNGRVIRAAMVKVAG